MSKPYLGGTNYNTSLENIRTQLWTIQEALNELNKDDLTRTQAVLLMVLSNALLAISNEIGSLERYGESAKDIDRAIKTGQLKL